MMLSFTDFVHVALAKIAHKGKSTLNEKFIIDKKDSHNQSTLEHSFLVFFHGPKNLKK